MIQVYFANYVYSNCETSTILKEGILGSFSPYSKISLPACSSHLLPGRVVFGKIFDTKNLISPSPLLVKLIFFVGSGLTKLGLFFLNMSAANDPTNLSLLGIYCGSDSAEDLRRYAIPVIEQVNRLNHLKVEVQKEDVMIALELKLYVIYLYCFQSFRVITGDMVFLLNIYGLPNLYSAKTPCLYCYTSKSGFAHYNPETPRRTLTVREFCFFFTQI